MKYLMGMFSYIKSEVHQIYGDCCLLEGPALPKECPNAGHLRDSVG